MPSKWRSKRFNDILSSIIDVGIPGLGLSLKGEDTILDDAFVVVTLSSLKLFNDEELNLMLGNSLLEALLQHVILAKLLPFHLIVKTFEIRQEKASDAGFPVLTETDCLYSRILLQNCEVGLKVGVQFDVDLQHLLELAGQLFDFGVPVPLDAGSSGEAKSWSRTILRRWWRCCVEGLVQITLLKAIIGVCAELILREEYDENAVDDSRAGVAIRLLVVISKVEFMLICNGVKLLLDLIAK